MLKNKIIFILVLVFFMILGLTITSCNLITYELDIIINPIEDAGTVLTEPDPEEGTYEKDTIVTLTPDPADGWIFKHWELDGIIFPVDNYPTIDVKMNEDKSVKAVFESYTLTINIDPPAGGDVTLDPDKEYYEPNEQVILEAVPAEGYGFDMWLGDLSGSENPVTITMDRPMEITALFETFTLITETSPVDGGSITITPDKPNYAPGEQVQVEAFPEAAYNFINWTGDLSGTDNPATITMDGDKSITAVFDTNTLSINIYPVTDTDGNPADPGDVSLDPPGGNYATGTTVNLTANANPKWKFSNWGGASIGFLNDNGDGTGSIIMDQDHVLSASYQEQWELILNINSVEDPIISDVTVEVDDPDNVDANGYYAPGAVLTLTPNPAVNHSLSEWAGANASDLTNNGDGTYSLLMNEDKEITANFIEGHRIYISTIPTNTGSITINNPEPYGVYPTGTIVSLTAEAIDPDYSFAEWQGTNGGDVSYVGDDIDGNKMFEITMNETKYITARFKLIGSESIPVTVSGPMWSGRDNFATAVYDGKLWVIGGEPGKDDIWSTTDGENWTEEWADAPFGVRYSPGVIIFDETDDGTDNPKLWLIGGSDGNMRNDVWSFDGSTWTEVKAHNAGADFPPRRAHQSLLYDATDDGVDNPTMWVIGGQDSGGDNLSDVWSSPDGINWTEVVANGSAPWQPRRYHTAHIFDHDGNGDKMYIIAGRSNASPPEDYEDDIWYSTNGTDWYELALTPQPGGNWHGRAWHRTAIFMGKIWIFGGAYNDNGWYHRNDVWSSDNGEDWVEVHPQNASDPDFWASRSSHASVVFDGKIWILGGTVSGVKQNDVWYMD